MEPLPASVDVVVKAPIFHIVLSDCRIDLNTVSFSLFLCFY